MKQYESKAYDGLDRCLSLCGLSSQPHALLRHDRHDLRMGDVWGASELLSQQDAEEFDGRNQAESDVNPLLGLGFM